MKKIVFKPSGELEKDDVYWTNIKSASESGDFRLLMTCIIAWAHNNQSKSMCDLERKFRSDNIPVYLIASTNQRDNMDPFNLFKNSVATYELVVYIGTDDICMPEILKYAQTYDENFERLVDTGLWVNKEIITDIDKASNFFKPINNSVQQQIHSGDFILGFQDVNINLLLQEDIRIAEDSGKKIVMNFISTAENGSGIYSLIFVDEQNNHILVSEIGIMMGYNEDSQTVISLDDVKNSESVAIILNNPSTWHWWLSVQDFFW